MCDNAQKLTNGEIMNENGYKVYDTAQVAFQKLEPTDGDVMVIRFPADIHPMQMQKFADGLQGQVPKGVTVLCTRSGMEIENFSEAKMNALGWYKLDQTKIS
jgi:hypothetical protein